MRLATCSETRRIDELTQAQYAVPDEVLMESAGALAAREIMLSFVTETRLGTVAIFCGPGNNGADGLVVARHLLSAGLKSVTVFLLAPEEKRSPLFRLQLYRLDKVKAPTVDLLQNAPDVGQPSLIVDAVFGVGLKGEVAAPFSEWIRKLNSVRVPIVSLDVPSGLDADRGIALGPVVRAAQTITFGLAKPGYFISDGPRHIGRLRILPIGFPLELVRAHANSSFAFTEAMASRSLPKRSLAGNKTGNGRALIFAGSKGMWGAALLCATSAYRVGAGYVTLASEALPVPILQSYPEILTADINSTSLLEEAKGRSTAVGIGPGLGTSPEQQERIANLIKAAIECGLNNVVLDADAITVVAQRKLWPLRSTWILTPHAGELSRVLEVEAKIIESDRFRYARAGAERLGCHVLLKGFRTVVASGPGELSGRCWVTLAGNSALAKAGTGDVLTGMIVGLLAQGVVPLRAASLASYIHGRMADEWVRAGEDKRALQASDLREFLPRLMANLGVHHAP